MEQKFKTELLSPGEFFDRFTIVLRKSHFDNKNYLDRLQEYKGIINNNNLPAELLFLLCELQMVNTDIWNLESDIRKGKEGDLGKAEVGSRALQIRDFNKKRIGIVNKINELLGCGRKETKFNHVSS